MIKDTTRTVLITGASSGMGFATAIALSRKGYTVYATARRTDRLAALQEHGIHTLSIDVTDESSIQQALQTITQETGGVDVLINNAGYGAYGAIEDVPIEEARHQMEVNVFGLARMMQLVTPHMRQAGSGTIINISSIGSRFGEAFGAWYHASKYAVEGLGDSARLELAPFGIKVVTVHPGVIKTEWSDIAATSLEKASAGGPYDAFAKRKAASLRRIFQGRLVSPPEVIADGIASILAKPNPKFRYAIGGGAPIVFWLRRLTSDRLFYYLLNGTG